jgi:hypothetical protein
MTTTNYINSNGLGLKVTQLPSGTFDLYFSNGFISTCYTEEELKLEKAIEPLREVYARVNPSRRSIFIAQVVYLLTK